MTRSAQALLATLLGWLPCGAQAASPAVTISVAPQPVEVCPGQSRRVQVIVRNEGTQPIEHLRLSAFTGDPDPASAPVMIEQPEGSALRAERVDPGGALLATLKVSVRAKAPGDPVSVQLRAEYTPSQPRGMRPVAVSTTTLDVKRPVLPGPDALKAEIKTSFSSLHEGERGALVLVLTNGSAGPLRVQHVGSDLTVPGQQSSPGGKASTTERMLEITSDGAAPQEIPPQQAVALTYAIRAGNQIVPGKYPGWFDVEVEAPASCGVVLRRISTFDVTLGVTGEAELLKLVDVPSLLFLPGFLVIAAVMLLWRLLPWRPAFLFGSDKVPIGFKDPEFWLLGITLSLLLVAVAPSTAITGFGRAYGLSDVARLWERSLLIGVGVYVLLVVADRVARSIAKHRRAWRELGPRDAALTTLRKMALKRWQIREALAFEARTVDPPVRCFKLWDEEPGQRSWVVPEMHCVRLKEDLPLESQDLDARDIGAVVSLLTEASAKGQCRVEWAPNATFHGPAAIATDKLVPATGTSLIRIVESAGTVEDRQARSRGPSS